jgi:Na+-driven multidrug efflux pump
LGGSGASLAAALTYSNVVFSGAVLIWVFNSLSNVIRGTGNMAVPAIVTCAGAAVLIPVSPCLIFGWGPLPRLGVAGGAVAVVVYYAVGSIALAAYLWSGRSVVRLAWAGLGFRWPLFRDILRVGAVAALVAVQGNLTIAIATGLVGRFGPAAIAGYGTGSRLEYLLVPLVFGLGGPLVAMVGTNLGAGQRDRAVRVAWIGAAIAAGLTELIGLWAAAVRMPGCRCSTPIPPCSTLERAICTRSVRATACLGWAWPSTSPRKGPGGSSGHCWRT